MSVYVSDEIDRIVAVDDCHAELVRALVRCQKPQSVLELGFGTGKVTKAIGDALTYQFRFDIVDNWVDFGGNQPMSPVITRSDTNFITADEGVFIANNTDKYDFIFSDADHHNAHRWWDRVYCYMLNDGGILCYHDVTNPAFPNLRTILDGCRERNLPHMLFDKNSIAGERCDRGLLVIFKWT